MQTTNDTGNSVKEKPKATMHAKETARIRLSSGDKVSDERPRGGRGVAGVVRRNEGSSRAMARSRCRRPKRKAGGRAGAEHGKGGRAGRGRSGVGRRDRAPWPSSGSGGVRRAKRAHTGSRRQARSGRAGGASAHARRRPRSGGLGERGPELGRAPGALAHDRMRRRGTVRRWSRRVSGGGRRVSGGGGRLAMKMGLEVKWVWRGENGFGGR
ncbi:hypothetical protein Syun_027917 [Stephania yunnanensis]|uniref:Uncharacterized protein n=1 Tax=Stephania yunnanensis TaxID=152371 RepID=A0AAP0EGE3_9MAGN